MPTFQDRCRGCLLGLAAGDALGGRFEARSAGSVRERCPTPADVVGDPRDELWYTDDTQMTIGVAEALTESGTIVEQVLVRAFAANYVPSRGYGFGARSVLEAMEDGRDYRAVAEGYYPGGSFGNGAAMRVAPVGLAFRDDPGRLWEQARLSALPTHTHPLGVEGAQLLALGVALCSRDGPFDRTAFFGRLLAAATTAEFHAKLDRAARAASPADLAALGNGIQAAESVPTALAAFELSPDSYTEAVGGVVLLGGDTDTLAAMTGALSGAYLGLAGVPGRLVGLLERSPKGRDYLLALADRVAERFGPA